MKTRLATLLACGTLFLGGCATVKVAAEKVTERVTERAGDKETLVGSLPPKYEPSGQAVGIERDVMNRRADTLGFISLPDLSRYLNGIRGKLLRAAGAQDIPGSVYVTADAELNALATPDGNIFINWGLLRYLRSEDEVAAVIGHELAHVLLRHHDSNMLAHYQKVTQWYHSQGVMAGAAMRNLSSGNAQQGLKKGEMSQMQNIQALVSLTTKVIAPSWQRTQERSADLLGVDLLVRAGYNPDGMTDLLSVLKQAHENAKRDPEPMEVANLVANLALGETGQKLGAGVDLLAMAFGSDHPDPQTRQDDVGDYLLRHYSEDATTAPFQRKPWESQLKMPQLKKLLEAYDGAVSAQNLLNRNKPKEAYELSRKTVDGARNHAYPAYVHAMTLHAVGKSKESDAALRYALENAAEPSGQVYSQFAGRLSAGGHHKEALAVVRKGHDKLGNAPQMVPLMVRYQRLSGDAKGANQTASECARVLTDFRDHCVRENAPPGPPAHAQAKGLDQKKQR